MAAQPGDNALISVTFTCVRNVPIRMISDGKKNYDVFIIHYYVYQYAFEVINK